MEHVHGLIECQRLAMTFSTLCMQVTNRWQVHVADICQCALCSHEVDIEVLTQDITRLFRKVEARLQHFGSGDATSEADEKAYFPLPLLRLALTLF